MLQVKAMSPLSPTAIPLFFRCRLVSICSPTVDACDTVGVPHKAKSDGVDVAHRG